MNGLDWREVKRLVLATEATGDNDAFNRNGFLVPMQRIVERAVNKAELYSSVGDPPGSWRSASGAGPGREVYSGPCERF